MLLAIVEDDCLVGFETQAEQEAHANLRVLCSAGSDACGGMIRYSGLQTSCTSSTGRFTCPPATGAQPDVPEIPR